MAAVTLQPALIFGAVLSVISAIDSVTDGAITKAITKAITAAINFLIQPAEISEDVVGFIFMGLSAATIFSNPGQLVQSIKDTATNALGAITKGISSSADELLTLVSRGGSSLGQSGSKFATSVWQLASHQLDDTLKAVANFFTDAVSQAQTIVNTSLDDVFTNVKNLGKGLVSGDPLERAQTWQQVNETVQAGTGVGQSAVGAASAKHQADIATAEIKNQFTLDVIEDLQSEIELYIEQIKEIFSVTETIFEATNELQERHHRSVIRSAQA